MLATTTWVMSLAVNMSPFMRFDGYYFLSDLLGAANLQPRAFAIAKHQLRALLFGFADPKPEELPRWLERTMVFYAVGTWIYRLTLFFGIALLVYHAFFKVLGIFLFCVEISVFILLPIMKELKVWAVGIFEGKAGRRVWLFPALLAALAVLLFWPWQTDVTAPAVIRPAQAASLYAPQASQVKRVLAQNGAEVKKGDLLFELASPETAHALEKLRDDKALLDWRISFLRLNRERRAEVPVAEREKRMLERRIREYEDKAAALTVRAPFDGIFSDSLEKLHVGEWVREGERLGVVTGACCSNPGDSLAEGFVSEDDLARIEKGDKAVFMPEDPFAQPMPLVLEAIDYMAARHLEDYPELASVYGGGIAALEATGAAAASLGVDAGRAQSPVGRLADYAAAVLIRETGF